MAASLLQILRSIPDHRRWEGQRCELAVVEQCAELAFDLKHPSVRHMAIRASGARAGAVGVMVRSAHSVIAGFALSSNYRRRRRATG